MSDQIDISSGGAIAVDTELLRVAAGGFARARDRLDEAFTHVCGAQVAAFAAGAVAAEVGVALGAAAERARQARDAAAGVWADLLQMADVYDLVELRVQSEMAAAEGDVAGRSAADARADVMVARSPELGRQADEFLSQWRSGWNSTITQTAMGLSALFPAVGWFGGLLGAHLASQLVRDMGRGTISGPLVPFGPVPPVTVTPIPSPRGRESAPATFEAAAERMPKGESRIRVEHYTMPDGTDEYVVYVAGTKGIGGNESFDVESNLQLYAGDPSTSYAAVLAALEAAGASPGDTVHAFAHSQGAMATAQLAYSEIYEVETHVTFGTPVEADLGPQTLNVTLRHTDDPVPFLTGGGHAGVAGSANSVVVQRTANASGSLPDAGIASHLMPAYVATAALVDASNDPRIDALRSTLGGLAHATSVEATEYSASDVPTFVEAPGVGGASAKTASAEGAG